MPVCIRSQLIELSSLGVTYGCGNGAFALQGELARVIEEPPELEPPGAPMWEHEDIDIFTPAVQG